MIKSSGLMKVGFSLVQVILSLKGALRHKCGCSFACVGEGACEDGEKMSWNKLIRLTPLSQASGLQNFKMKMHCVGLIWHFVTAVVGALYI